MQYSISFVDSESDSLDFAVNKDEPANVYVSINEEVVRIPYDQLRLIVEQLADVDLESE